MTNENQVAPIHIAAGAADGRLLQWLLKAEANPNLLHKDGATPLLLAAQEGRLGPQVLVIHWIQSSQPHSLSSLGGVPAVDHTFPVAEAPPGEAAPGGEGRGQRRPVAGWRHALLFGLGEGWTPHQQPFLGEEFV